MNEPIKNVEEFIVWTKKLEGGLLVYRGMADASWEVSASTYRRIGELPEAQRLPIVFQNYMKQLLESAGLSGFRERQGKQYSDLELLAELQHNGAATCLIDFTTNALVALWIACWGNSEEDGKVVALATDNPERFSRVEYKDLKEPIETFLHQNKLWKWVPSHLSNRIVAQQSVFVFGEGKIDEKDYESINIDRGSKKNLIKELEERFGITEQYLFSDFTGFALSNAQDRPYNEYKAEDHFYLGLRFQQQGDYEKAIDHYGRAIELDPQFALAYNGRGVAKRLSGDYQGAIADHDTAIKLNPKDALAYNGRGVAKRLSGDYQGAIADHDTAIKLNPNDALAYNGRGIAKRISEDYQGAIADHDTAIKLNPNDALAYNGRGVAKQLSKDYPGAIADSEKAIELNPQYAGAYNSRGVAKRLSKDYPGAIADHDTAIKLNPKYTMSYNNRGIAKRASGDYQGAIADFDRAIELNPQGSRAYHNRGVAKRASGDVAGAQEDFAKAQELAK